MKLTMKDIAKKAGVTESAVSKVLNNKESFIGKTTRNRILEIVRELDYQPNHQARSLSTGKSFTIGFAGVGTLGAISNLDVAQMCAGAGQVCEERGYTINLYPMGEGFVENTIRAARSRMVDGLITQVYSNSYEKFLAETCPVLTREKVPFVAMHATTRPHQCNSVGIDSVKCGSLATRHLLDQGFTDIGIIYNPGLFSHAEFHQGYCEELTKAGFDTNGRVFEVAPEVPEQGYQAGLKKIKEDKLCRAYVIFSDALASGFALALYENGLKVARDVAIVAGEDILKDDRYYTPFTCVDRKYRERGAKAAEMLFAQIDNGKEQGIVEYVEEPELIVRKSSVNQVGS